LIQQPGIDLNLVDKNGQSAMSIAKAKGFSKIEKLISKELKRKQKEK